MPQSVRIVEARHWTTPGLLGRSVTEALDTADLVLIDDADHSPDAAAELWHILLRQPAARLVVTARSPLHLPCESVIRVPPLPDVGPEVSLETYAAQPAVRVFLDAAHRTGTTADLDGEALRDIAAICAELGGIPKAIEMAAARSAALCPSVLLARLRSSSRAAVITSRHLGHDLADDHDLFHTMRWSASLLSNFSRDLLGALSVFHSAVSLDAIEAVTARPIDIDALSDLVEAHLVDPVHSQSGSHYRLSPLVREHALELLADDPERAAELRARHTEWAVSVMAEVPEIEETAVAALHRPPSPSAASGASCLPEQLTEREREVLGSMISGATNKELSLLLGISAKTVMHHTSSIYRKLGVRSRSEAVAWAMRHDEWESAGSRRLLHLTTR
ncbi:LuxR C-terminal-related transcriptional regulator [Knoellia locipacati]|uniref:LuxR C-terminal-related transcriptional regulator n=1 Tax=Knoellia locipacati TaxID=882824 RepID=UPI0038514A34